MDNNNIDLYSHLTEMNQPYSITSDEDHQLIEDKNEGVQDDNQGDDRSYSKKSRPSQNSRLRKQNEDLAQRMAELERQNLFLQKQNLEKEENTLKLVNTNLNWAKTAADQENDVKSRNEADDALMDIKLKIHEVQRQKDHIDRQANYHHNNYSSNSVDSETKDNYEEFLERNPIVNFKDSSNPNYSPDVYNLAQSLSSKLSLRYKMENRGHDEFSREYFHDLENLIKSELGNPMQNNNNSNRGRNNFSAPVSSSNPRTNNKNLKLTPEEQSVFNGFMKNAVSEEHKEAIRKRFVTAKQGNFRSGNLNLTYGE